MISFGAGNPTATSAKLPVEQTAQKDRTWGAYLYSCAEMTAQVALPVITCFAIGYALIHAKDGAECLEKYIGNWGVTTVTEQTVTLLSKGGVNAQNCGTVGLGLGFMRISDSVFKYTDACAKKLTNNVTECMRNQYNYWTGQRTK